MERPYKIILVISLLLAAVLRLSKPDTISWSGLGVAALIFQISLGFMLFAFMFSALYFVADAWAGKMKGKIAKPHKVILLLSVLLPVTLYFIDVLWLDPVPPVPGWKYKITNFTQCFVMYGLFFYFVLTGGIMCSVGCLRRVDLLRTTKNNNLNFLPNVIAGSDPQPLFSATAGSNGQHMPCGIQRWRVGARHNKKVWFKTTKNNKLLYG